MEKVIGYMGVHEQARNDENKFKSQIESIQKYANTHHMEVETFLFEYLTYTKNDYPQIASMILSIENNNSDSKTVLIEHLGRISDDVIVQQILLKDLKAKGFNVISTIEETDHLKDASKRIFISKVIEIVRQYDKEMMVAKLQAARKRKRARGEKADGRIGYHDTKEGRSLIQRINHLRRKPKYKARMTLKQVAEVLNKEGIPTMEGKAWTLFRVQQVINFEKRSK